MVLLLFRRTSPAWRNRRTCSWSSASNILHLGRNNTLHQYMLGAGQLENSFAGKDLRVLGNKMTVSQQQALVAKAANGILACMREVSLTFCCAAGRHIWRAVSGAEVLSTRETWTYWNKSSKGPWCWLKNWTVWHMGRGWEMALSSLEQRRLRGSCQCVQIPDEGD